MQFTEWIHYFKAQSLAVYHSILPSNLKASPQQSNMDRVLSWVQRRGNTGVTARDLVTAKLVDGMPHAEKVLKQLVDSGQAEWREVGARIPRLFLIDRTQHSAVSTSTAFQPTEQAPVAPIQHSAVSGSTADSVPEDVGRPQASPTETKGTDDKPQNPSVNTHRDSTHRPSRKIEFPKLSPEETRIFGQNVRRILRGIRNSG